MPNFGLSGALAKETNTVKGVELKYNEPPEATKPELKWRLYVFKGKDQIDLLHIHRQSAYLIGRDRAVTDIPIDHPSCSKQHAVIQYRLVDEKNDTGKVNRVVKPFIIDLEATNGTFLNGEKIPSTRYVELKSSDVLKFGSSTRDYVLLHTES
ncbi:SMAD/FHA domain-containing protein [Sporodiniella umbellata]|nr:SMAD/FHA domain-containing protein [Sporodiniella umbellata]